MQYEYITIIRRERTNTIILAIVRLGDGFLRGKKILIVRLSERFQKGERERVVLVYRKLE